MCDSVTPQTTINQERKTHHMTTTITPPQTQRTTLYYREGSSDKVYQAAIEPEGDLFLVTFAFGRRGTTLSTGTKTPEPVDLDTASRIYDKLIREKKAKGYTEGPDGTPYQHTEKEDRATGILPQLLNPIDESQVQQFLEDPRYCAQEKYDGRRILIRKEKAEIHGINRKGLLIGLPETVFKSVTVIPSDFILDGECIGDLLYAFDVLECDGQDNRSLPYHRRLVQLSNLLNRPNIKCIKLAQTATDPANKERLFRHLQAERKEGVVFKRLDAPYTPGRPKQRRQPAQAQVLRHLFCRGGQD